MCVSVLLVILLVLWLHRRRKPDYLIGEPDQDVRENMGFYDEEGAGRLSSAVLYVITVAVLSGTLVICSK